jgi:putative transposase
MKQSRSAYYYKPVKDDTVVIDTLREWAEKHSRYGFWLLYKRMRRSGIAWNHKRLYRIYKLLNLSMRRKSKKRIPARVKEPLDQPEYINKSWSMDFMSDCLASGQRFRTLNIMDDFNREVLHIEVSISLPSQRVVRILEQIKDWRGLPEQIRVDNGPEFIGSPLMQWAENNNVRMLFIQPGKPMQNGFVERFNKTYRNEVLDQYLFFSLHEVREITSHWIEDYNCHRPHDSLNDCTPVEYAGRGALTVDNSTELPTINTPFSSSNSADFKSKSNFELS